MDPVQNPDSGISQPRWTVDVGNRTGIGGSSKFPYITRRAGCREEPRERTEGDSVRRWEISVGALYPTGSRGNSRSTVTVGVEPLELGEPATDADVLRHQRTKGIPSWVKYGCRVGKGHSVACIVDAITKLLVAAGDESGIEEIDGGEDFPTDEQTTRRGELLAFEVLLNREAGVVIVAGGEGGILRESEFHVTCEVVGVGCVNPLERVLEPVLRDSHVGIDKGKYVGLGVADPGVAGCVGGLYVEFVVDINAVVVLCVAVRDIRRIVGRTVVDDVDVVDMVVELGEEGVEGCFDAFGIVVNGNDDGDR